MPLRVIRKRPLDQWVTASSMQKKKAKLSVVPPETSHALSDVAGPSGVNQTPKDDRLSEVQRDEDVTVVAKNYYYLCNGCDKERGWNCPDGCQHFHHPRIPVGKFVLNSLNSEGTVFYKIVLFKTFFYYLRRQRSMSLKS